MSWGGGDALANTLHQGYRCQQEPQWRPDNEAQNYGEEENRPSRKSRQCESQGKHEPEYLSLPKGLTATVEGRSSWGRLGLIIATACNVDPGFKGCLTLELVNNGEAPLVLYPGVRIAQLVFHRAEGEGYYRGGKYDCPVGPQFSRIGDDKEIPFWGKPLKQKGATPIELPKPNPEEEAEMKAWPTWQVEPSEFPWHYQQQETCLVVDGEVTVEAPDQTVSFGAGDYVVFPQGLECIWRVKKTVRKHCRFG